MSAILFSTGQFRSKFADYLRYLVSSLSHTFNQYSTNLEKLGRPRTLVKLNKVPNLNRIGQSHDDAGKIFHSFAALTRIIIFSTLKKKFRLPKRPHNILYSSPGIFKLMTWVTVLLRASVALQT